MLVFINYWIVFLSCAERDSCMSFGKTAHLGFRHRPGIIQILQ